MKIREVTMSSLANNGCDKKTALYLATEASLTELLRSATEIRETYFGNIIELCVILNARSGACSEDCRFCAQSAHNNSEVAVYPLLSEKEILIDMASKLSTGASNYGIVTSGATIDDIDLPTLCKTISKIAESGKINPCASLGRFAPEKLKQLKMAGLKRYHHNLETSRNFYPQICTTHNWQERVNTVIAAKEVGLEVCSGGLFGLGESWEDRIDLAFTLKELEVDCIPLNFLHSHVGTPLAVQAPLTAEEALRIIAVYRHILPKIPLRICGGRPKILGAKQSEIFSAGANALMTGDYLTTDGINFETDQQMIANLGLVICER